MKTIMTLGLVATLAALGGCGAPPGTSSVEIVAPEGFKLPTDNSTGCTWPEGPYLTGGTMDVSSGFGAFSYPFLIENHLTYDPGTNPGSTDTFDFLGQKVVVDFKGTDDATTAALSGLHSEIPQSITVRTGGTGDIVMTLVPSNVGKDMATALALAAGDSKTVLALFHVSGTLVNGTAVDSTTFQYPIEVCNGCLAATCPAGEVLFSCGYAQTPIACVKDASAAP